MIWCRDVLVSSTCTWFVHTLTYMYYKPSKTLNNLLHKLIKLFIIANMRNVWDKRLWIDCLLPRNIRVIGLNKPQTSENSQSWISLRGNDITIMNVLIAILKKITFLKYRVPTVKILVYGTRDKKLIYDDC